MWDPGHTGSEENEIRESGLNLTSGTRALFPIGPDAIKEELRKRINENK